MTLLKELIEIQETVHQGDFVLKLSDGVARPAETLSTYVVTPQLVDAFDRALDLVRGAVGSRSSKGALLHGSFGSGKSHFMAVLHQLLRHDPDARSVPELAPVVARHSEWLNGKKFLLIPYHMIGARNLESAILGRYVEWVRTLHPDAPLPEVYVSDALLANAAQMRSNQGDESFFRQLNADPGPTASGGWGALASKWDAASFDRAIKATHGSEVRSGLVSDLIKRVFPAFQNIAAGSGEGFVPIDLGLSLISKHAASLGYHGLVLFLDELILWLLSHMADQAFVEREGSKLVKLVEAGHQDRPVPIISFIARQRDLKDLVGEHVPGAEKASFADTLKHMNDRFAVINLEDRNLPLIVQKRLLAPRSAAGSELIAQAFRETEKLRPEVMSTLLGKTGDREMFRQVYPFSPALIQTLVAVSSLLQRERTALKLLVQLLSAQRERLTLGDVVPVGDLFDVLAEGDEPFSQEMKAHFLNARKFYRQQLVPLLEARHGFSAEEYGKLAARDPKAVAWRGDDRILKTLLLASLSPEVEALRDLTASRLVNLNHGSIKSPIPGQETTDLARRCREWAAQVGAIRLTGEPNNPVVSIQFSGIEIDGLLEKAQGEDNTGNRRRKLRELLFARLHIPDTEDLFARYDWIWRGSRRAVEVVFDNVRELSDEALRNRADDWRVILDFPFDPEQRGPSDDVAHLEKFQGKGETSQTVCWLPVFLSREAQADLGKLVILDHMLKGERLLQYTRELSDVNRVAARGEMESRQSRLREQLGIDLEIAYGVRPKSDSRRVDASHELPEHLHSLDSSFRPRPPVGATLGEAFEKLLDQMMSHLYPAHPEFTDEVRTPLARKVYEEVRRACEAPDGRIEIEKAMRDQLRRVAMPLKLGTMHEMHFVLEKHWVNHFARKIAEAREKGDHSELSVGRLRKWFDEPRRMGLAKELQDLVILVYADQTQQTFFLGGGPTDGAIGSLRDELVLREEPLPSAEIWEIACRRAAALFGITVGAGRTAANVANLVDRVREGAKILVESNRGLLAELKNLGAFGLDASAPRVATARAALELLERLRQASEAEAPSALASAAIPSTVEMMGRSIKSAADVARVLNETRWSVFDTASKLSGIPGEAAAKVIAEVREALHKDELAVALEPVLKSAEMRAWKLVDASIAAQPGPTAVTQPTRGADAGSAGPAPKPRDVAHAEKSSPVADPPGSPSVEGMRAGLDGPAARELFREIEADLQKDASLRLTVSWRLDDEGGA